MHDLFPSHFSFTLEKDVSEKQLVLQNPGGHFQQRFLFTAVIMTVALPPQSIVMLPRSHMCFVTSAEMGTEMIRGQTVVIRRSGIHYAGLNYHKSAIKHLRGNI